MDKEIGKRPDFLPTAAACFVTLAILILSLWPSSNDFTQFSPGEERKQAFIDYFAPLITEANARILADRETALELRSQSDDLGFFHRRNLRTLAENYALEEFDTQNSQHWDELLKRINTVPVSLALAQAANESAWGTSRFAREGNNYFGQWCFEPGCGLLPENRASGKTHEVARFSSPAESVKAYIENLNSNSAYEALRSQRAKQGESSSPIGGMALSNGLLNYSERGQDYVHDIQGLIQNNQLEKYDRQGS